MRKHQAGAKVARSLRTSEHALDEAIAAAMRLGAEMVEGRRTAGLAAAVGQPALAKLVGGLADMNSARAALIEAHEELLNVAGEHEIRWRLDTAAEEKPTRVAPPMLAAANAA